MPQKDDEGQHTWAGSQKLQKRLLSGENVGGSQPAKPAPAKPRRENAPKGDAMKPAFERGFQKKQAAQKAADNAAYQRAQRPAASKRPAATSKKRR
jgi:hypothetical protein